MMSLPDDTLSQEKELIWRTNKVSLSNWENLWVKILASIEITESSRGETVVPCGF